MTDQPKTEGSEANIAPVSEPDDLRPVLWENLQALMLARWGRVNLTRLGREASVGVATIKRIQELGTSTGLDVVSAVAHALSVRPWQLLTPDLDPASLPRVNKRVFSPQANDLAAHLDRISDAQMRQRAYAAALAVIDLAASSATPPPLQPGP